LVDVSQVALASRVHRVTVGTWRARFVAHQLDGLLTELRPGAPRTIADATIEDVLRMTLKTTPKDATHCSTRRTGERVEPSQTKVMRIWHAFGLHLHRVETFKLSTDPLFIENARDVVGLYLNPSRTPSRHRAVEFRKFLDRIEATVPPDLDIRLSVDNASTHKTPLTKRWLAKRPRYHMHFTPTGSS
jgi:hypothetical protein